MAAGKGDVQCECACSSDKNCDEQKAAGRGGRVAVAGKCLVQVRVCNTQQEPKGIVNVIVLAVRCVRQNGFSMHVQYG
eukprot:scaffold246243_cov21-Tisochrysis_lutea.AAC.1